MENVDSVQMEKWKWLANLLNISFYCLMSRVMSWGTNWQLSPSPHCHSYNVQCMYYLCWLKKNNWRVKIEFNAIMELWREVVSSLQPRKEEMRNIKVLVTLFPKGLHKNFKGSSQSVIPTLKMTWKNQHKWKTADTKAIREMAHVWGQPLLQRTAKCLL